MLQLARIKLQRILLPTNSAASSKASSKLSPTRKAPRDPVMERRLMLQPFGSIICHKIVRRCLLGRRSRSLSNARSLRVRHDPNALILLRLPLRNRRQPKLPQMLLRFLPLSLPTKPKLISVRCVVKFCADRPWIYHPFNAFQCCSFAP